MAITLEHFCTKTGKSIVVDGQPLTETIEHCLAEYFSPNATYKLGAVYQGLTTEADLLQFKEQGLRLEFSSSDRFYFMDQALREKIFDQPHFGAAYGSNLFTPCKSFGERKNLSVLVVDATTGENGGVMPPEEAIKLVGDGDGKIDVQLHENLGNQAQTPFQTRFGIKERRVGLDSNNDSKPINQVWQIGKGTFAPRELSTIGNGYDLVISTDQLKGRKNVENAQGILGSDRKLIQVENEIKPGEYTMTIGIGNKTDAYYGITATGAQFWNSFPLGVQGDVLPLLEKRLEQLKDVMNDPRKIAQDYITSTDARLKYQIKSESTQQESFIDFEHLNLEGLDKLIDNTLGNNDDQDTIYRILKADLDGHCQVLELPKIIEKLQEYWREQYLDCASGRFIKFDSAMAQTCHDLADREVCYPNFPEGEELIVYRSPTANSNTINVFINRRLPNEPLDKGTIKMSPTALKLSLSDCDGDRMAVALASEFPYTTAEIKEKQLEENRFAEIVKLTKKAYEGSFEQIAIQAMENHVGLIANLCMKGIALENECLSVPKENAFKLMKDICLSAVEMLRAENDPNKSVIYPVNLRKNIVEITNFCREQLGQKSEIIQYDTLADCNRSRGNKNLPLLSEQDLNRFLENSRKFYHDVIGILGGQLQIELDRGKSANRSEAEIVSACKVIVTNPDIAPWVEERKIDEVYATRPMKVRGHGAIDMMVRMTNEAFEESALVARSTQQFQDLFKDVQFTQQQKDQAVEIKKTYDSLINRAIEISREVEEAPGPRIIATIAGGNAIEIIGLAEFKHPQAFDVSRKLDLKIVENNSGGTKAQNKWMVVAPIFDSDGKPELKYGEPKYQRFGYISLESANKYPEIMKQWEKLEVLTQEFLPGLNHNQVRSAFRQVREFSNTSRESILDSQKEVFAAAIWQVSTANKENDVRGFKKTSAIFAMFGDELLGRLHELQFTDFAVVGTHKPSNEHLGRKWSGEKVQCSIEQAPDPVNLTQNKRWLVAENKKLGIFRSESAQLPIGTSFQAEIASPSSASVIVTSTQGNQLKVGHLKKYAFADREWNGEAGVVTINVIGSGKGVTPIAFIDGKPLGVIDRESLNLLSEKLSAKGRKVEGFKFNATLESAPATIANIKVDPETIQYPEVWTREEPLVRHKKLSCLDELKPLLNKKYKQKNNQGLLYDDEASLGAVTIKSEYFETLMQDLGKSAESFKALSDEIDRKFGLDSFIGICQKGNTEELYFCVTIPSERSQQKTAMRISDNLSFPLSYDQLENGRRTKFIAIPLDELQELFYTARSKIQLDNQVITTPVNIEVRSHTDSSPSLSPLETVLLLSHNGNGISNFRLEVDPAKIDATTDWLKKNGVEFNLTQPYSSSDNALHHATFTIASIPDAALNKLMEKYPPQVKKIESNEASVSETPVAGESHPTLPLEQPINQFVNREDWEETMLKCALASLKANPTNVDEEIQTATFAEGKYRVIHYVPTETLRIIDELSHRGTLYKVQKGKPAQTCEFSQAEKKNFRQLSEIESDMHTKHKPKILEQE